MTPKVRIGYKFAAIPEWVLYHDTLTHLAVRIYGVLARHGMTPDDCFPSHARIAACAGIAERSVARPLAELEEVGAVRSIHRGSDGGGRTSDGYWLAGDQPLPPVTALQNAESESVTALPSAQLPRSGTRNEPRSGTRLRRASRTRAKEEGTTPSSPDGDTPAPLARDYGFEEFWTEWPARGGKKVNKGKALDQWAKLDLAERKAAWRGARNYARASAAGHQGAMDAFRWLRDRLWPEWQTPGANQPTEARGAAASLTEESAALVMGQYAKANGHPRPAAGSPLPLAELAAPGGAP